MWHGVHGAVDAGLAASDEVLAEHPPGHHHGGTQGAHGGAVLQNGAVLPRLCPEVQVQGQNLVRIYFGTIVAAGVLKLLGRMD